MALSHLMTRAHVPDRVRRAWPRSAQNVFSGRGRHGADPRTQLTGRLGYVRDPVPRSRRPHPLRSLLGDRCRVRSDCRGRGGALTRTKQKTSGRNLVSFCFWSYALDHSPGRPLSGGGSGDCRNRAMNRFNHVEGPRPREGSFMTGTPTTVDDAGLAARLSALPIEDKVQVLTGAVAWSTHLLPAISLEKDGSLRRPGRPSQPGRRGRSGAKPAGVAATIKYQHRRSRRPRHCPGLCRIPG
jgi:hypothetical protein